MPEIFTLQQSDDLSSIVERIRTSTDDEVAVLIPKDRQAFINPTTLRLLLKFSDEAHKSTRIISNDPRVQLLAKDAGFHVFATIQNFHANEEVGDGNESPVATLDSLPQKTGKGKAVVEPLGVGGLPPVRAGKIMKTDASWFRTRNGRITIGAIAGVVVLFLVVFAFPSATVTVTLNGTMLQDQTIIQGSPTGSSTGQNNTMQTHVLTGAASQTFQATPTGTTQCCGASATGYVEMSTNLSQQNCTSSNTSCSGDLNLVLPKDQHFTYTSGQTSMTFQSTQSVCVSFVMEANTPQAPQQGIVYPLDAANNCNTQPSAALTGIPVQDVNQEAAGNLSASASGTWIWKEDPCTSDTTSNASPSPSASPSQGNSFTNNYNCPSNGPAFVVAQQTAFSGGVDQKQVPAASVSDITAFDNQVSSIEAQLTSKIKSMIKKELNGEVMAQDPAGDGFKVNFTVSPALPTTPGTEWSSTTVTVQGNGAATVYSPSAVRQAVVAALKSQVPAGEVYAPASLTYPSPTVTVASSDGTVILSINAKAFSVPSLPHNLANQLAGRPPSSIETYLQSVIGGQVLANVQVNQSPYPFFFLPFSASRITVVEKFKSS
ncbi:MAG: hypothetical protein ACP5OR_05030 [Candidatus Dormibacteria bacterium]